MEQDKTKTQQGKQLTDPVALSHTGGLHSQRPYRTPSLEISMSPVCYFHCLYAALHDRCLIAWYLNTLSSQNNTTLTSFPQLQAMDSHRILTGFLTLSNTDGCNSAEFNQTTEEEPMTYQFSIYLVSRTSTTWIMAPNLASKL